MQGGLWASQVLDFAPERAVVARPDFAPGLRTAVGAFRFIGRVAVWSAATLLVLSNLNVNVSTLIAGLGVGGIAIALAVQNVLGDLFASLSILLDRPFVVGEFIVIDSLAGTVEHVGLKTTRVRSLSGEQIVMSNSDVLKSRKGLTVEIGNTDAEGRLVLADALAAADEESPDLLIDMATLTGAARVALGPDMPPFYTNDEELASTLSEAAASQNDPLWRLPLWEPYNALFESTIADINNVASSGLAGSITAALFLKRFVDKAKTWAHLDIFAWTPSAKPARPLGGEAQGIRALYSVIAGRFR